MISMVFCGLPLRSRVLLRRHFQKKQSSVISVVVLAMLKTKLKAGLPSNNVHASAPVQKASARDLQFTKRAFKLCKS